MTKKTLLLIGQLLFGITLPHLAQAQDLPAYQPLEVRHVCTAQPIRREPDGVEAQMLAPGQEVLLRDVTFDRHEQAWFALDYPTGKGLERATGYLPVTEVRHFCPVESVEPQPYLAPPNTCHLVAGRVETLDALNDLAATLPAFAPSLSGYRLQAGGYALTLGLVSTGAADRILTLSDALPDQSHCASGSGFAEALVMNGKGFAPVGTDKKTALAILTEAQQAGDPAGMKQACDLGLGSGCAIFARRIFDDSEGPDRGPAIVTRYGLLGCMAGHLDGCLTAVNRLDNTLELTQEQALAGGRESVTTELAKLLCDARDRVGCVILTRGTAADRDPTLTEAASNFAANLTACQQGIAWVCEELGTRFEAVTNARGESRTRDERYALAGIDAGNCTQGPRGPNQRDCKPAYYGFRDFLDYGDAAALEATQVKRATAFLDKGCAAGDPAACVTVEGQPEFWPEVARRAAAARAISLCETMVDKDSVCDNLGAVLDPTAPEARRALRSEYDRLTTLCLAPDGGNYQDCTKALHLYAALDTGDDLAPAERMLHSACSPENTKGCQALARLYGDADHELNGITIHGRKDAAAELAALRMGCENGDDRTGNTCSLLAEKVTAEGDDVGALRVRRLACERLIAAQDAPDLWDCYEAAKLALKQKDPVPEALSWADFTCAGADTSVTPYGCKLMGNILSRGLGVPADPAWAQSAYRQGCFHPRVSTTDGEACLFYGNILIETVRNGEQPEALDGSDAPSPSQLLTEASRAFDMGCMDDILDACAANQSLLEERSSGDLPYDAFICQVRNGAGEITSEKPCRGFDFYQASDEMKQRRKQLVLNVYVWPDGDRTVTYAQDGDWRLNEIRTEPPEAEGATECWHNPISDRRFCTTPG